MITNPHLANLPNLCMHAMSSCDTVILQWLLPLGHAPSRLLSGCPPWRPSSCCCCWRRGCHSDWIWPARTCASWALALGPYRQWLSSPPLYWSFFRQSLQAQEEDHIFHIPLRNNVALIDLPHATYTECARTAVATRLEIASSTSKP